MICASKQDSQKLLCMLVVQHLNKLYFCHITVIIHLT